MGLLKKIFDRRNLGAVFAVAAIAVTGGAAAPFVSSGFATAALAGGLAIGGGLLSASAAARSARRAAARAAEEAARGRPVSGNVSGGDQVHNLVFGKARVGGVIFNTVTIGTNNTILEILLAHSLCHVGGIQGVSGLWINERSIPLTVDGVIVSNAGTATETRYVNSRPASGDAVGMVNISTFFGLHTQQVRSDLVAAGIMAANDHAKGIAWSRCSLIRDLNNDAAFQRAFSGGIPQISVELMGLKCYDPRQDSTRGGSGAHRADNPLSWVFSDNPACVSITYLLMRKADGGCGVVVDEIDYASFAAAATACDATLPGTSPPVARYRFNGALSTADTCEVNLDRICLTMAGKVFQEAGVYRLRVGAYQSPTATITDDWLAGGVQITNGAGLEGLYNAVRPVYTSPANNYTSTEAFPFTNAGFEAEDGGQRLFRELSLPNVINDYQAQYLAQIEGRRSRLQRTVVAPLNLRGLTLTTGQTVALNFSNLGEIGGANVYVVEGKGYAISDQGGLIVNVLLSEERADIYDVAAFGTPSTTPAYPDIYESPQAPFGFAATGVADGINLIWRSPSATTHTAIEIEIASASGGPYSLLGRLKGDAAVYADTSGATTFFRIRAVNAQGQFSPYAGPVSAAAKTVQNGATVGARLGGTLYSVDGSSIVSNQDGIPDGATFVRSNADVMTGNRPDLSKPIVNRVLDFIANTASFVRTRPRRVDGNGDPYVDLSEGINQNRTLDFISNTASWVRTRLRRVNGDGDPFFDLSEAINLNRQLDFISDSVTYARTRGGELSNGFLRLGVAGSGARLGDQRNVPALATGGQRSVWVGQTISASYDTATPAAVTISVSAATLQFGAGVSYNAMSLSYLQNRNTVFLIYLYTDDANYSGGARTLMMTTNFSDLFTSDARIEVGRIRVSVPAASTGGGSTGTPGGGGGNGQIPN